MEPPVRLLDNLKWKYQFGYVRDRKRFYYELNQETGWWRRRVSENENGPETCHYCPEFWTNQPDWRTAEEWATK